MGTYPEDIMEAARALRSRVVWESNEAVEAIAEALQGQRFAATYAEREFCIRVAVAALMPKHPILARAVASAIRREA